MKKIKQKSTDDIPLLEFTEFDDVLDNPFSPLIQSQEIPIDLDDADIQKYLKLTNIYVELSSLYSSKALRLIAIKKEQEDINEISKKIISIERNLKQLLKNKKRP